MRQRLIVAELDGLVTSLRALAVDGAIIIFIRHVNIHIMGSVLKFLDQFFQPLCCSAQLILLVLECEALYSFAMILDHELAAFEFTCNSQYRSKRLL